MSPSSSETWFDTTGGGFPGAGTPPAPTGVALAGVDRYQNTESD